MPKLPTPGREGRIGLGFRNVALIRYVEEPRLPGRGDVGYILQQLRNAPPARPRWDITVTASRVNRSGRPVERMDRRTWRVRRVANQRLLELPVPERHGLYRVTADLRNSSGRKLRSFGYYFRVAKPIRSARLALNATSFHAGQSLFARVENHGALTVLFGAGYVIERLEGDTWRVAPETPRVFILPLFHALPGRSGRDCSPFNIPPSMPAGHYRMVKEIEFSTRTRGARGTYEPATLTAEFNIVP